MSEDSAKTVIVELPADWTNLKAELKPSTDPVCLITPEDRKSLERLFGIVTVSLLSMISVSLAGNVLLLSALHRRPPIEHFDSWLALLGMMAGFLGSSTAALRSALERHAQGVEDGNGNQWPDPKTKKERFNSAMAIWFLYRPVLGTVVGFLLYLAGQAGAFKAVSSEGGLAFSGVVGGLFAKSLLDLLLDRFKELFSLRA
ncbi:MAG: hypothetical protein ABSH02_09740 [Candidatus Sulfotelmatobacter sp.]|jgi:hypothetical protein